MATKLKRRKDAGWQQRRKNRERHDKNARKKQFSLVRKRCENENIAVPEKKHKKIKYKNIKIKKGIRERTQVPEGDLPGGEVVGDWVRSQKTGFSQTYKKRKISE